MFNLSGKTVLITGSAGGLGKEFAQRILQQGAKVCLTDIKTELGQATEKEFVKAFGADRVHFEVCNVTNADDVLKVWQNACQKFEVDHLDVLVNNAGVMGEKEGWKLCLDINLRGVLNGCTLAMEKMSRANGGRGGVIVNVASILGLFNAQQPKGWAYNTSKSAVVTYSRCVGTAETEAQDGIRILTLCPSVTQTPILDGCTQAELAEMKKNVGGFLQADQVGKAFMTLLQTGQTGSVMSVWKDCPPYYIPDTGMGLFILYTTCAMVMRFVPKSVFDPTNGLKFFPHMTFILVAMLVVWILVAKFSMWLLF
ncbi:hypothetical protein TCAL_12574 [Tigriopus californicus]|uniref:15-hydroxyprostaglandin dehydrogenase [NAD(+)] n=1 Tax=Tigriopus californicus TaxID=6832 RepID=A0A553NV37_TIGCA|nr:15-hydroxyprostaglandin dehydrogenase [NAD(+)]-like [Tigriopus californicus]TRY69297.1 hypothetical protein TCAL_12574 [Tigriopus californicus]|eukprot:TCALIF_12574-PA protein Name:"Similar to Hpgd 15-hydroxyprostaglandin dehydrogenase [NAD(+)] (Mus musculus)" AED:0.03 eAED:0.03 QI:582/1/1/1/1/1/2/56/310